MVEGSTIVDEGFGKMTLGCWGASGWRPDLLKAVLMAARTIAGLRQQLPAAMVGYCAPPENGAGGTSEVPGAGGGR